MIAVREYLTAAGRAPFSEWLNKLRDSRARTRVMQRITRLEAELFGDCRSVGEGVEELRIAHGPGYRVYFGRHGRAIVVLLLGGDKRTQQGDIKQAKIYWREFKSRQG